MNYKQMVLLETLVNSFGSDSLFRVTFLMFDMHFYGEFLLRDEEDRNEQWPRVHSERLKQDYLTTVMEEVDYFEALSADLKQSGPWRDVKFRNTIFNTMVVFLMEIENQVDDYFIDEPEAEMVYNLFTSPNKYVKELDLSGMRVNPFDLHEIKLKV